MNTQSMTYVFILFCPFSVVLHTTMLTVCSEIFKNFSLEVFFKIFKVIEILVSRQQTTMPVANNYNHDVLNEYFFLESQVS